METAALFKEATNSSEIILFLNNLQTYINKDLDGFHDILKHFLSQKNSRCVGGIDEKSYYKFIKKNPEFKTLFRPIWIHDLEAPLQL